MGTTATAVLWDSMLLLTWLACTAPSDVPAPAAVDLDPPAAEGAQAPALATDGERAWLAWLEPSPTGQQLRAATLVDGTWDEGRTIADGPDLLASWADTPRIAHGPHDALVVAFPVATNRTGYDLHLARSTVGSDWIRLGPANADRTPTEHGFPSLVPTERGVELLWLDGRDTTTGGATGLRQATLDGTVDGEELVDDRVCDCCSTDAVAVGDRLAVAYRDRTEDERRDVRVAVRSEDGWRSVEVAEDGWQVGGCPVNGPAIEAVSDALVVAWYTGAPAPEVRLAWSFDGGGSFDPPYAVERSTPDATPLGRVDLVAFDEDVVVSWTRTDGEAAQILAQRHARDGRVSPAYTVATMRAANLTGFPRLGRIGDRLLVAWSEAGPPGRIRARAVPAAALGSPDAQARRATTTGIATSLPDVLPRIAATDAAGHPTALDPVGRPTLVNLWASWCAPCRAELPELVRLSQAWSERVGFVGLVVDDRPERASIAAREAGVRFPQLFVDAASARAAFGSAQVPASYLFDGSGRLVWSTRGRIEAGDPALDAALRRVAELNDQASP